MLRVTIELVPFGREDQKRKIGEMVLANDQTSGLSNLGNYQAWISADDWSGQPMKFGRVCDFDRKLSSWHLLREILEACLLEDHKPDLDEDSVSQLLLKKLKGDLL